MIGPGVDLELRDLRAAERTLGQHALDRVAHGVGRLAAQELAVRLGRQTAGIPRVAVDPLGRHLVAAHHDLVGVDDHDVVTGVDVGSEDRLVLAAQDASDLGSEPAEDDALGVDHVPFALDLAGFRGVGLHRSRDLDLGQPHATSCEMNRVMIRPDQRIRQRGSRYGRSFLPSSKSSTISAILRRRSSGRRFVASIQRR